LENRLCDGCNSYAPLQEKILIIKLGARGDVLRTTPLVAGLRKIHPQAHITWLTDPEAVELLHGLPGLARLLPYGTGSLVELFARTFDLVLCLDKEPKATGLTQLIRASRKLGWGLAAGGTGTPCALNPEAEYSLALGVSDALKFRHNTKTYLELIFEAVGLTYAGEPYVFELDQADRVRRDAFFKAHKISPQAKILGLLTGCGPAYERKRWTESHFAELARRAKKEFNATVLLLGGPGERAINARIKRLSRLPLLDTRGEHTLRELGGFLERCRVTVAGDTLALHMALALKRPTLALFGPTCPQEISMFGCGEKLVTPKDCAPCYKQTCGSTPSCMDAISVDMAWKPLVKLWGA
jgi:heptosyltransferase-2